ncbi:hypothetical protein ACTFIR_009487 [Dictyostelium discoideum]
MSSSNNIYHILDDLVKMVIRAFYPDEYAVIIDGLLREKKRIKDEDLALRLRIQQKYVRKILMDLKGDSMVKSSDVKVEAKGPNERGSTHLLWYIDYKHIIDIVKYKLYMFRKKMESVKVQKIDVQTYKCQTCHKVYTALDIPKLLNMDTGALACEICDGELEEELNNESLTQTAKHQSDLFSQLRKIIEQLKKTEGHNIPLFARDLADLSADQGPSYTINTNSSLGMGPKPSAFPVAQGAATSHHIDPTNENIEFHVDILDTDGIEINKAVVKKENKKTGLASLPPWLLPSNSFKNRNARSNSILNNNQQTQTSTNEQPTAVKEQIKIDQDFYINYIKTHYQEWESAPDSGDGNGGSTIEGGNDGGNGEHQNKKMKLDDSQTVSSMSQSEEDDDNGKDILVRVGDNLIPITKITEHDQELMSNQEYEDYSHALYSYASKNVFDHQYQSLMSN